MKKGKREKKENDIAKVNPFFKVIAIIFILITILFCFSVLKLNILPVKYITLFVVAEAIITLILLIGLAKKHKTITLNIISFIIVLLLSGVYIFVTNYAMVTSNFMDKMFSIFEETEEYYIVVNKDSSYYSISDIKDEKVYQFKVSENIKDEIKEKTNISFETIDSLKKLGEGVLNKKLNVIALSSSQYAILNEDIKDFKDKTKVIYTVIHKIQPTENTLNSNNTIKKGKFNVYVSGIDTFGEISNVSRTDANIVATINTKTHEVLLTSIPRDYYVTLHSFDEKDKLTHSGIYGINETISTIEDLLEIDISYYVRVNFTTLTKLVDTLDGIDVYSDYDFSAKGYTFYKGYNHLNGEAALVFSRERYSFEDGDNQRGKNQQYVIEAIAKKVLSEKTILTKYANILYSLEGTFQTNINQKEISYLVKEQLDNMPSWKMMSNSLSGSDSTATTYSMGSTPLYVMIPDYSSVEEAKEKIEDVLK